MKYRLFIFFIIFSCKNNDCKEDFRFISFYEKSLFKLELYYIKGDYSITEMQLEKAFSFIGSISKHGSSRIAGHFGLNYSSPKDFPNDLKIWKKWLDTNRCSYTMEEANDFFVTLPSSMKKGATNWQEYLKY